ncbi:hypothetical protein D3C75_1245880 [compost metagenome]
MKYRVILGWVTVSGPPDFICLWKSGITEPEDPSTLPKRTMVNLVLLTRETLLLSPNITGAGSRLSACKVISASRLVLPMMLVGRTALSVEINTKLATPACSAA